MNKNLLIATAVAAGASALVYFIRRNRKAVNNMESMPVQPSRHLTDAFAKAKQNHSNGSSNRPTMSDKI